ncbi:bifunctional 3-(3-hydroxy-phenyl)propionate/3-hydroxycinnamic acid hydroxylase [Streptomyces sp. NPDC047123]|uniref:bifunctional 3-(3-hydroxy-phenyl)propionate/3-hydroxycinnamic acid hydroxylase MhpA n=1 Tax=Streptomyces sp. NPDC047123 TaxID=3155622 RepID=UPI0033FA11C0
MALHEVRDTSGATDADVSDVLVVGAGPVGLACALFLARHGWTVTVLERRPEPYPRPRAVHFDDEVARLLAGTGLGDRLRDLTVPADTYDWRNADGETLLHFDWSMLGPSGWPTASMMHQPDLEQALVDVARTTGTITVLRDHTAVGLVESTDAVRVTARDGRGRERRFDAPWVVGCDGANSFVRTRMPTRMADLGFFYDWLIVDVCPHEERTWTPVNLQICDPARPTTAVSGGPGRRRWEFMRMPGETVEQLNTAPMAWELLTPWGLTPDNCTLERHAVYTFQARWADVWRSGRLLLAGDAAHLMPPFAGQGMCSGIRDAANLAWKLDLVLKGEAAPAVLDTYGGERGAHVQHAIGLSVELGKVICVTDPEAAALRDTFMTGRGADPDRILPALPPARLLDGVVSGSGTDGAAGVLGPQPRVCHRGRTGLLDEVVGHGFVVASTSDPRDTLTPGRLGFLARIGARLLHLVPPGTPADPEVAAVDVDGVWLPHLQSAGHIGVLIRPDHYLFGAARETRELSSLVDELASRLAAPDPVPRPSGAPAASPGRSRR